MIIRETTEDDYQGIVEIWKSCFTNDLPYIDAFINHCLPYSKCIVATIDSGEIVSSLTLIPTSTTIDKINYKGYYLYAVGTIPEHRGNFLSKHLLDRAHKICLEENVSFLITKPATESLYTLYEKLGFSDTLFEDITIIRLDSLYNNKSISIIKSNLTSLTGTKLFDLRPNINFSNSSSANGRYFDWPKEILDYAIIESEGRNGLCVSLRNIYLIAYPEEGNPSTIKILESNFKSYNELITLTSVIKVKYPYAKYLKIISPVGINRTLESSTTRSGLIHIFNQNISEYLKLSHLSLPLD